MKKKLRLLSAFTLAEVLIVLGILGVIAEMTIPTLIQDSQKQIYVTSLKKVYTNVNQALIQISVDKGCPNDLQCAGLFATDTDNQTLGDEIVSYFRVIKNCKIATGQGCWPANTNQNYDGTAGSNQFDNADHYKFITTDGMSFAIENRAILGLGDCMSNWSQSGTGNLSQVCGNIYVDVNGLKGPNRYGRDTFAFLITNGKGILLYPPGGMDDTGRPANFCSTTNKSGYYCATRVMEEGWQMNY